MRVGGGAPVRVGQTGHVSISSDLNSAEGRAERAAERLAEGAADQAPAGRRPRVGLLGTGPWAHRTHAPALAAHAGSDFAGVWGRRPEAAAELAHEYGVKVYEDPDELFAECDAVAFALPPDVQAAMAVRAAAAGCHLLLDKPVATTVEDARAVAEAAARHQVASVVFLTLRFAEPTAGWVEEQAARSGWFTAAAHWLGAVFPPDGTPSAYADSPWRKAKGGLWDVGPHALSVLIPVLGEVTAISATRGPSDVVQLALRHTSGAASTAVLSLGAPRARRPGWASNCAAPRACTNCPAGAMCRAPTGAPWTHCSPPPGRGCRTRAGRSSGPG